MEKHTMLNYFFPPYLQLQVLFCLQMQSHSNPATSSYPLDQCAYKNNKTICNVLGNIIIVKKSEYKKKFWHY